MLGAHGTESVSLLLMEGETAAVLYQKSKKVCNIIEYSLSFVLLVWCKRLRRRWVLRRRGRYFWVACAHTKRNPKASSSIFFSHPRFYKFRHKATTDFSPSFFSQWHYTPKSWFGDERKKGYEPNLRRSGPIDWKWSLNRVSQRLCYSSFFSLPK